MLGTHGVSTTLLICNRRSVSSVKEFKLGVVARTHSMLLMPESSSSDIPSFGISVDLDMIRFSHGSSHDAIK